MDHSKDIESHFRLLQLVEDYNAQYIDPEYEKDPYCDGEFYDKKNLQFRHDKYPPTDDEDDPEIKDSKLFMALIELWQPNPEANITDEI